MEQDPVLCPEGWERTFFPISPLPQTSATRFWALGELLGLEEQGFFKFISSFYCFWGWGSKFSCRCGIVGWVRAG